jgi:hypothetical protein
VHMQSFEAIENVMRASHGSPWGSSDTTGALCDSRDSVPGTGVEDTVVARKAKIQSRVAIVVIGRVCSASLVECGNETYPVGNNRS